MKAAVVWTISDFLGYGMLSSQTTKGLPEDHPWRFDAVSFDGKQEFGLKPQERSSEWILDMLNSFDFGCLNSDPVVLARNPKRPSRLENWTHTSIFFELPYWKKLRIRHCLDVMHMENNVCDNIVGIVFGFKDKTKDTEKARKDFQLMNIRPHLWLIGSGLMSLAHYRINPANEKKVFKWFEAIKYPYSYAGNISRCVKVGENKLFGLKSHDCHIMLPRLFPVRSRTRRLVRLESSGGNVRLKTLLERLRRRRADIGEVDKEGNIGESYPERFKPERSREVTWLWESHVTPPGVGCLGGEAGVGVVEGGLEGEEGAVGGHWARGGGE
ncbi:hypothetical protein ACLB2K_066559 [Fragaria x ananassa]